MKGIKNKPDFIEVYKQVSEVVCRVKPQRETALSAKENSNGI